MDYKVIDVVIERVSLVQFCEIFQLFCLTPM